MTTPRGHDSEPVRRVLEALEQHGCKPRPVGRGYQAFCPVHEADGRRHKPSLALSEGQKGVALVYCFAGCRVERIVEAIGLSLADLMSDASSRPAPLPNAASSPSEAQAGYPTAEQAIAVYTARFGRPPDARWHYLNAGGYLVGVVLRWDTARGKVIRPVARHRDAWWYCTAMPSPRPLYRLSLIQQAPPKQVVWVVEGEKAAHAMDELLLLATTSAGGAKAAKKTDWKPLRGRVVIIIPDNDAAGKQYAETVARLAHAAGAREIRIVDLAAYAPALPEGGDIADVLEDPIWCGLPLSNAADLLDLHVLLYDLADNSPVWQPSTKDGPARARRRPVPVEAATRGWLEAMRERGYPRKS
ncbi:MAG: hypothetical protein ACUVXB_17105 [Bryobacteraceae bacterium]